MHFVTNIKINKSTQGFILGWHKTAKPLGDNVVSSLKIRFRVDKSLERKVSMSGFGKNR